MSQLSITAFLHTYACVIFTLITLESSSLNCTFLFTPLCVETRPLPSKSLCRKLPYPVHVPEWGAVPSCPHPLIENCTFLSAPLCRDTPLPVHVPLWRTAPSCPRPFIKNCIFLSTFLHREPPLPVHVPASGSTPSCPHLFIENFTFFSTSLRRDLPLPVHVSAWEPPLAVYLYRELHLSVHVPV